MLISDLLAYTRYDLLRDKSKPPLWSDTLIVSYLDEAQQRIATRAHLFVEDDRELELTAGQAAYALDSDIVYVHTARIVGRAQRLVPVSESWMQEPTLLSLPVRYSLDRTSNGIRFDPIPDDAYTVVLRVARLPAALSIDDLEAEIETTPRYQLALADWAAYRCLSNDDVDGRNDGAAANALLRFNTAVNEQKRDIYQLKTGSGARVHGQRVK